MRKKAKKEGVMSWVMCFALAIAAAIVLRVFVFEMVLVDGRSMNSTLENGEYVFAEKLSRYFDRIDYGDIVITRYPNEDKKLFVKRVIAKEGDTLKAENGTVYLKKAGETDFTALVEGYINEPMWPEKDFSERTVPEDCYFVMGDNRNHSSDSRMVGFISEDMLRGRVMWVLYPFKNIRSVADSATV